MIMEEDRSRLRIGIKYVPFRKYKIGKTVCLWLCWMCLGLFTGITSPTLPDLRDNLAASMEQMSIVIGMKNIGMLFGCMIGSMLADRYRSVAELIGGLSIMLSGGAAIVKPYANSLPLLGAIYFIDGVGHGSLDPVGSAILLWMWGEHSGSPMHATHMGFPIGAALAPLLAYPFLGPQDEEAVSTTVGHETSTLTSNITYYTSPSITVNTTTEEPMIVSRIQIPYGIVGGLTLLVGMALLVFFLVGLPKGMTISGPAKTKLSNVFSKDECIKLGTGRYTVALLVLSAIFFAFLPGKYIMDTYVFSYAVDSGLSFTNKEAALLETAYRSAAIASRLCTAIVARWVPPQPMIFTEMILSSIMVTCLAFFGTDKKSYIWIFLCFLKFTGSPVWPTAVLWIGEYIEMRSMIVALFIFAYGLAGFFFNWLTGSLYDTFSPDVVPYVSMGCHFVMLGILVVMQCVASFCPGRKVQQKTDDIEIVSEDNPKFTYLSGNLQEESTTKL